MRDKIKTVLTYIFRGWEDEPGYIYPRMKILPPFFYKLLAIAGGLSILYQLGVYLWNLFNCLLSK